MWEGKFKQFFGCKILPENPQDADGRCGGGSGLLGLCLILGLFSSVEEREKNSQNNFSIYCNSLQLKNTHSASDGTLYAGSDFGYRKLSLSSLENIKQLFFRLL